MISQRHPKNQPRCAKPEIIIGPDEKRVNDGALTALADHDEGLYQRGGRLVTVVRDAIPAKGFKRPLGTPTISAVQTAQLRERLAEHVRFIRIEKDGDKKIRIPAHPPTWCYQALAARGSWKGIRPLEGITEAPVLRRDGTILSTAGYDVATGLLYEPNEAFPEIPNEPTRKEAIEARKDVLEVVCDFPFERKEHESAYLAALLTPLSRHAFEGPAPLFLADANTRGAGKTMLMDSIGWIITGRSTPRMTLPRDDAEMDKRITASCRAGDKIVLLDNISGLLGSPSLDAALTGETWKGRILGESNNTPELPLNQVWLCTGNNVTVRGDTSRRICYIRLQSPEERPEERKGFKHPELKAWVIAHRPRLLTAALTILRAYCSAGRPNQHLKPWGSYEGWSALVRSAIVWAGGKDPAETREEFMAHADRDANTLQQLLEGLRELDEGERGLTASKIIEAADSEHCPSEGFKEAVQYLGTSAKDGKINAQSLGMRLNKLRGRVVGGLALTRGHDTSKGALWYAGSPTSPTKGEK